MLKFTIKLVSDAGFQNEITSASTAQHQPEVFSGLVKSALLHIASARLTEVEENMKDFKVHVRTLVCCCTCCMCVYMYMLYGHQRGISAMCLLCLTPAL